jgi:hypothetical protein
MGTVMNFCLYTNLELIHKAFNNILWTKVFLKINLHKMKKIERKKKKKQSNLSSSSDTSVGTGPS